jgi:hypothetical protein
MTKMPTVPAPSLGPSLLTAGCRSLPGTSRTRAAPNCRDRSCFGLLNDAQPGDILLVEQVDRLSRWRLGEAEGSADSATCSRRGAGFADVMDDGQQQR